MTRRSRSSRRWAPFTRATSRCSAPRARRPNVVVASLFVNPAQFGEGSDLNGYPRDEAHDISLAETAGVDILFAPDVDEMYPPGFQTSVDVEELGARLEGVHRPGHFRGVATICLKLFNIVRPQRAYFGRRTRSRSPCSGG